jgi:hypothetical protein
MKITKRQLEKRQHPCKVNNRWFFLTEGTSYWCKCSFHEPGADVYGIPVTKILRALDERGFLDQWDRRQQVLRKVQP